ncbi:hypothetical protein OY671_010644, partial [Metschnikowia pulcherrima]
HDWRDDSPAVRGRIGFDSPMAPFTWFRVGGPAEVSFRPADIEDSIAFSTGSSVEVPVTTIGVGSNSSVRDGGVPGVVIRSTGPFAEIETHQTTITAGAGASDLTVARTAQEAGIAGSEFSSGVPGTVGGASRMNAGAFGTEMKDVTVTAEALDRDGQLHILGLADFGFGYRH